MNTPQYSTHIRITWPIFLWLYYVCQMLALHMNLWQNANAEISSDCKNVSANAIINNLIIKNLKSATTINRFITCLFIKRFYQCVFIVILAWDFKDIGLPLIQVDKIWPHRNCIIAFLKGFGRHCFLPLNVIFNTIYIVQVKQANFTLIFKHYITIRVNISFRHIWSNMFDI